MNKKYSVFLLYILSAFLVALDQLTKYMAVAGLKDKPALELIPGVLELSYLENRGAAFGMLQNKQVFFAVLTLVVVAAIVILIARMPDEKRFFLMKLCLSFLLAGAIGNLIDRRLQNYVVDFIYFKLINFPVFNVADIYVTCSVAALALLVLFYYSEEEFDRMTDALKFGGKK